MLAALINQLDDLAKTMMEIEVQCKRKDRYISPHERRRPKDDDEEASMLGSNCEQVDFHPIDVMMFRDRILTFKQLEGRSGKIVVEKCRLVSKSSSRRTTEVKPNCLMAETNQEIETDFMLAALINQLDDLVKMMMEIEVQCKRKDRYISPHERRRPKDDEGKRVEGMLLIILQKVNDHDRLLEEMKENIKVLSQMIGSHSRSIQLIENLMGHVWPHLHPKNKRGRLVILWPTPKMRLANKSSSRRTTEEVGDPDPDCCWTQESFTLESVKLGEAREFLANHPPGR
uniref:Integrase core domain containing protein n=1 Tax=Solanum tuberosum TaxID=4113 RepID=M1DBE8_SOLTU